MLAHCRAGSRGWLPHCGQMRVPSQMTVPKGTVTRPLFVRTFFLAMRSVREGEAMKRSVPARDPMRTFMTYFILPVWVGAGVLDYIWHRRTRIETTSGLSESITHSLMMIEAAPAVLGGLFPEINEAVIADRLDRRTRGHRDLGCVVLGSSPRHSTESSARTLFLKWRRS